MKSTTTKTDKKITFQKGKGISENADADTDANHEGRNVFVEELKEIYFTEKALIISIPIMIKNATTDELMEALKVHLQFTQDHIKRLEFFFTSIGEADIMLKYDAMYGQIAPEK